MKRKHANSLTSGRKKPYTPFQEAESAFDQSEQYRLATVKFPIDALTPEWKIGANRPVNEAHKRRLLQIFKEIGVLRQDASHRLHIACSKAQVQQMLNHLREKGHVEGAVDARNATVELLSFEDWDSVIGEKAELMAGNHRVEAFKEYLQYSQSSEKERWWVCNVYDQDALPQHLHIKLRANREDIVLPDSHGQIWAELATLSSTNDELFRGSNKVVEQKMLDHLGLSGRSKFPVRRLATLWKNERWNPMITKWCQFSIGEATFVISTFEWIASCRIDDYWFTTFDQVTQVMSKIRSQCGFDIQLRDWNKLAKLPAEYSREDMRCLFYPGLESDPVPQSSTRRQRDFLTAIDDDEYYALYQSLSSGSACCFFDIQALLKITKQEGKLMSTVMAHVVQWMNREPTRVADRDNNKPLLRKDLVACLHEKYGDEAEQKSIALQQQLLDYVRCHSQDFASKATGHYLIEYPDTHNDKYAERFEHIGWQTLLLLVLDFAGPHLQHPCMVRFNSEELRKTSSIPPSIFAQVVRDLICEIPEVARNPALQSASAVDRLSQKIQQLVARWITDQCAETVARHSGERGAPISELVEAEHTTYEESVEELSSSQPPILDEPTRQLGGARETENADGSPLVAQARGSAKEQSVATTKQTRGPPTVRPPVTQLTTIALHDLRAKHRAQHATRQQEDQITSAEHRVAPSKDDRRSKGGEQHRVPTIRGSGHWRQKAAVTHRSR